MEFLCLEPQGPHEEDWWRGSEEMLFALSVCFQMEGDSMTLDFWFCLILKNILRLRVAVLLVLLGQN